MKWVAGYTAIFALVLAGCAYMDADCGIKRTRRGLGQLVIIAALWPLTVTIFVIAVIALTLEHMK